MRGSLNKAKTHQSGVPAEAQEVTPISYLPSFWKLWVLWFAALSSILKAHVLPSVKLCLAGRKGSPTLRNHEAALDHLDQLLTFSSPQVSTSSLCHTRQGLYGMQGLKYGHLGDHDHY